MKVYQSLFAFLAGLAFAACGANPALSQTQPAALTAQPSPPKPSAEPTTGPEIPIAGGTVTVGLVQEPDTLNPLQASTRLEAMLSAFMVEGLLSLDAEGNYTPALAESLPVISEDGLSLTYSLKRDVRWSDGEAFTCADLQFTLAAILSASSRFSAAGYRDIESLDCPDAHSAVVTLARPYAPYLRLFSIILPASAGDPQEMAGWRYNRAPTGTGPWLVSEWRAGDSITLAPNPYYREAGQPYLEAIVLRFLSNHQAGLNLLGTGEITILWDVPESELPALQELPGTTWGKAPSGAGENELLLLNLGPNDGTAPADPSSAPHPSLSDLRVRQAIQYALDKQQLADALPPGGLVAGSTALPAGPFACPQPVSQFDLPRARALLAEAGWRPGSDGIRIKDGLRLSLRIATVGSQLRAQTGQAVVKMLRAAGIEARIDNLPEESFFASWEANGLRKKGRFDMLLYTSGADSDPDGYLFNNYHSLRIPSEVNGGLGSNFSRYANAEVDEWLDQAAATPNSATRRALYCQVIGQINRDLPRIFLYERFVLGGYRENLQNFHISPGPDGFAADSQRWWLRTPRPSAEAAAPFSLIASRAATPPPTPSDSEAGPLIPPPASQLPQFWGMLIGLIFIIGAALLAKFRQTRR